MTGDDIVEWIAAFQLVVAMWAIPRALADGRPPRARALPEGYTRMWRDLHAPRPDQSATLEDSRSCARQRTGAIPAIASGMATTKQLYTTLPLDQQRGWQPTAKETGWYGQHKVTGPHVWAVRISYSASSSVTMHGPWDRDDAARFARSTGDGDRAQPVQVAPYYYCEAWGRVPAESVHELDEINAQDWSHRPDAARVLGSAEVAS